MFELEKEYWDFHKKLKLFDYIIPLNLSKEREKFISHFNIGSKYNPIFRYKKINYKKNDVLKRIKKFGERFKKYSNTISLQYKKLLQEDIEWVENFHERENPKFCDYLSNLYGKPGDNFYNHAINQLKTLNVESKDMQKISFLEMKERIVSELNKKKINNWHIKIKNSSSRLAIDLITKEIIIKKNEYFNLDEINRLLVHEIGTHVLRYENGSKQKYMIFKKGFPDYLKTEEGLAILSEYKNNLLSSKDLIKYCCRLIASYHCFNLDFWDIFRVINNYLEVGDAFDVVARVKRGLIHTDNLGGFTKDQIYFTGYLEVKNLSLDKIRKLYIGKIGIQHLNIINELDDINFNINLPNWIESD